MQVPNSIDRREEQKPSGQYDRERDQTHSADSLNPSVLRAPKGGIRLGEAAQSASRPEMQSCDRQMQVPKEQKPAGQCDHKMQVPKEHEPHTGRCSYEMQSCDREMQVPNSVREDLYYICGIDIGIIHLGVSFIEVQYGEDPNELPKLTVLEINLIDLKTITEDCKKNGGCKLYHGNSASDRISHFFKEYDSKLQGCKYIYIERQPITGITVIEQLIYNRYREKSFLVHPLKIHKYFGLPEDVELRKQKSIELVKNILVDELKEELNFYERKHDITDSVLIAMTGFHLKRTNNTKPLDLNYKEHRTPQALKIDVNIFEKYKYRPS